MEAIISGRAGVALLLDGDRVESLRVGTGGSTEPCDLEDFPFLFADTRDLDFLEDVELPQVVQHLAREHSKQQALQLALIALDESLSMRTRRAACEELESLLSAEEIEDFLERVLHAHVLPPSADLGGALAILPGRAGRVRKFLRRLETCQMSIASVQYAWQGIPSPLFGGIDNLGNARAVAVREGLFRDLVRRCRDRESLETFVSAGLEKDAVRELPNARGLLEKWVALLHLEEGPSYPVEIPLPESSVAEATEPTQGYLEVPPRSVYSPRRVSKLRILAMASNPLDEHLDPVDAAREIRNLEEAVGATNDLEIFRPNAPTLAALREACFERECNVLHFIGHGGWAPGGAGGVLFFEAEDGSSKSVWGEELVSALAGCPTLRLVVLNACESAVHSSALRVDPLASVARSLVLAGVPTVVAMQLPMSDQAAVAFSRAFYQRLAAGDPVEVAVAEGRLAVHSADPDGIEWAPPVLFRGG